MLFTNLAHDYDYSQASHNIHHLLVLDWMSFLHMFRRNLAHSPSLVHFQDSMSWVAAAAMALYLIIPSITANL